MKIDELEAKCWDYGRGVVNTQKFARLIIDECEKLNKAQSYELAGVIIDTEAQGFDTVCLDTVTRVEQYLAGKSLTKHFYEHLP